MAKVAITRLFSKVMNLETVHFDNQGNWFAGLGHDDQKTFDAKTEDADPQVFGAAFNP
jgi:hypothetical protein